MSERSGRNVPGGTLLGVLRLLCRGGAVGKTGVLRVPVPNVSRGYE